MDKASLRNQFLLKRQSLSRRDYWSYNDNLLEQFKSFDWEDINTLHIFLPIKQNNEVDTFAFIEFFKTCHPQIELVIPRTNFEEGTMESVLFDPLHTVLRQNKFGIPEPIYGEIIPSNNIDAILMPLLAFDKVGNRVGYGKGFYDRFILSCNAKVNKIGISLFEPVDEIVNINEHDQKMDFCITPHQVWAFSH